MNLLLYGIGKGSECVESCIKEEHIIIGYTDSISEISIYKGKKFYKFDEIKNIDYDKLIITIQNKDVIGQVIEKLVSAGINQKKIIPFFLYAETQLYKIKLCKSAQMYEGIILGNSHAKFGFPEKYFTDRVINLASPSQDIYYNHFILKKCLSKYKENFKKLKYIVIDLYDYNYFNIDVSRSKVFGDYIRCGGVIAPHNFSENMNFSKPFLEFLSEDLKIIKSDNINPIMKELFRNKGNLSLYMNNEIWKVLSKEKEILQQVIESKALLKRYDETIQENIFYLEEMIKNIYVYNPKVKIIVTLLPRYISMEKQMENRIKQWKKEFEDIIYYLKEKYNLYYFDFKNRVEISTNSNFYYDGGHLNERGGICMVSILDNEIKNIFLEDRRGN